MKEFKELLKQFKELRITESINYELMNEALISHHSTAIEGSSLTEEETRLLIVEGLTAKGKPMTDHYMVKDHQNALIWVIDQAKEKRAITPEFIQNISSLVMKNTGSVIHSMGGSFDSSKGDWRKTSVSVGVRYFTNFQKVEREVKTLTDKLETKNKEVKSEEDIYNLAFDAHFYLVSIHPFADGNGRTSRLLMNYILACHQQPLAIIFQEDKADYYKALEASRAGEGNIQPIRDFMYSQQEKYLKNELEKFRGQDKDINMSL